MEELLQELADGEPGGPVMETAGTTAEKKGSAGTMARPEVSEGLSPLLTEELVSRKG